MLFRLGLALLFFLPVIESFDRKLGMALLLFGSIFVSLPFIDKKKIEFDAIERIFLIILVIFSISTVFSWSVDHSFTELLRYTSYFLIFVSFRRFEHKDYLIKRFFVPSVIANSLILAFIFLLYLIPIIKLPLPASGMNLFYPNFRHNRISDILILAIPLSIGLFHNFSKKRYSFLASLITAVFIICLILSMGLGTIISLAFAFFIYAFLVQRIEGKIEKIWERLIAVFGLIAVIFIFTSFVFSNFIIRENQKTGLLKGFIKPLRTDLRLEYIRQAIEGVKASPVTGTGLDTFRFVSRMFQVRPGTSSWYVHNQYIEIFQSTGVIGGIIFIAFVIILLIRSGQNIFYFHSGQNHIFRQTIFIGLLSSSILGLMDYNFQHLSIFLFWYMGTAILIPKEKSGRKNFLVTPVYILIIILFSFQTFFIPDNQTIVKTADEYAKNNSPKDAVNTLERYLKLDRYNGTIVSKLLEINLANKNYGQSHRWYQYAIFLQPVNSDRYIKDDYLLYLKEAQTALRNKDVESAVGYINYGSGLYPVFGRKFGKSDDLSKDRLETVKILNKFIEKMKQVVVKTKIGSGDIEIIKDINRKTVRLFIDNNSMFDMLILR